MRCIAEGCSSSSGDNSVWCDQHRGAAGSVLVEAARRPGSDDREKKLDQHDEWAHAAALFIRSWLEDEERLLVAVARGRHAEGSLRYGDRLMYEYTQDELLAEASQELGDAINYLALWLARNAEIVSE